MKCVFHLVSKISKPSLVAHKYLRTECELGWSFVRSLPFLKLGK